MERRRPRSYFVRWAEVRGVVNVLCGACVHARPWVIFFERVGSIKWLIAWLAVLNTGELQTVRYYRCTDIIVWICISFSFIVVVDNYWRRSLYLAHE